jgi:hypothetical protein
MQTRNMNKEFIPYEQALALKELGFDEPCFAHFVKHYDEIKCILNSDDFDEWWTNNSDNLNVKAPLYQQAFRWFRKKKYQAEILWRGDFGDFCWKIGRFKNGSHFFSDNGFKTYEEAELECLKKLIEIVKNG